MPQSRVVALRLQPAELATWQATQSYGDSSQRQEHASYDTDASKRLFSNPGTTCPSSSEKSRIFFTQRSSRQKQATGFPRTAVINPANRSAQRPLRGEGKWVPTAGNSAPLCESATIRGHLGGYFFPSASCAPPGLGGQAVRRAASRRHSCRSDTLRESLRDRPVRPACGRRMPRPTAATSCGESGNWSAAHRRRGIRTAGG